MQQWMNRVEINKLCYNEWIMWKWMNHVMTKSCFISLYKSNTENVICKEYNFGLGIKGNMFKRRTIGGLKENPVGCHIARFYTWK